MEDVSPDENEVITEVVEIEADEIIEVIEIDEVKEDEDDIVVEFWLAVEKSVPEKLPELIIVELVVAINHVSNAQVVL